MTSRDTFDDTTPEEIAAWAARDWAAAKEAHKDDPLPEISQVKGRAVDAADQHEGTTVTQPPDLAATLVTLDRAGLRSDPVRTQRLASLE